MVICLYDRSVFSVVRIIKILSLKCGMDIGLSSYVYVKYLCGLSLKIGHIQKRKREEINRHFHSGTRNFPLFSTKIRLNAKMLVLFRKCCFLCSRLYFVFPICLRIQLIVKSLILLYNNIICTNETKV
jgi:hypothetical protein